MIEMRIPLLVGACPRLVQHTARVRLHEGKWAIMGDGVDNSDISISHESHLGKLVRRIGDVLIGPCVAQVEFDLKGSEKQVSIYAELVK